MIFGKYYVLKTVCGISIIKISSVVRPFLTYIQG